MFNILYLFYVVNLFLFYITKICYLLSSVPTFWLGLLLLLLFAVKLGWFPIGFSAPIGVLQSEVTIWQRLHHLLPAMTLQFASFAELFGGSVMAENVFSYPGLGSAVSAAGLNSDLPLLLGVTLFSALFVCVGNLIANLLYGVVDPQIREVGK